MVRKGRWVVSCKNSNQRGELAVRSRACLKWVAGAVALAVVGGVGSTLAWDEPAKPKDEPPGRQAKRPPTARIQTNLDLASKTKVEFRQPAELAFQDFNELVLQVGTFESMNAEELELPSKFQLLCY